MSGGYTGGTPEHFICLIFSTPSNVMSTPTKRWLATALLQQPEYSHKEILEQTFFKWTAILDGKRPFCVFEPPPCVKRVLDFILMLIELFSLDVTIPCDGCYDWGATSEYRLKTRVFAGRGSVSFALSQCARLTDGPTWRPSQWVTGICRSGKWRTI